MLRYQVSAIDDPGLNVIAKIFLQRVANHPERVAAIVTYQVLDVLEKNAFGRFFDMIRATSKKSVP